MCPAQQISTSFYLIVKTEIEIAQKQQLNLTGFM